MNNERFVWYLNEHFRSYFKSLFLNVNEKRVQNGFGFIAILSVYILFEFGCIYTYFNGKQLSVSPIFALGIFCATTQVSKMIYIRIHLNLILFLLLQLVCKYVCKSDLQQLFNIAHFIGGIYAIESDQKICTKYMDITEKIIKLSQLVFLSTYITLAILSPIVYYLIAGEMMPSLPI